MKKEFPVSYDFGEVEGRLYEEWERGGYFSPEGDGEAFTVVIPPPNVTGSLHMGHALNNTIQDIMVRFRRMKGERVLWQPGTDHAGIATQMVVERQLAAEGLERREMGREAFLERVWSWKEESEGRILGQLRRLGMSCDWSRTRFTLDEGLSEAVREVFVRMYEAGLIYRDKRLVNWDPVLETALSDLELVSEEQRGFLWYVRYDFVGGKAGGAGEGGADEGIVIATTRPETLLGDSGVAVHPEDERYGHMIGGRVCVPIVNREVEVVGDEEVDREQGSGALKVTPSHDHTDFRIGKRHGLEMISIFTSRACVKSCAEIPERYHGLSREEAREKVLEELEALGCLVKVEEIAHTVPKGDRSEAVIEPYLSDQWFVDAEKLAVPAIGAVEDGEIKFVPSFWENTYFSWMRNIEPWCISRQLWWGHSIPAWYGEDGEIFVARSEEEAYRQARVHYGREDVRLRVDEDVLDTWFSSALWPFSTLGWPQDADGEVLKVHYPTDVLLTGFDIIFFWVARMIMAGYFVMGEKPFHTVYVHALVRDSEGRKMSKSKGNVLDPLVLMDKYGCDALRFALAVRAIPGRDVKIADKEVETARNFVTKLWNVSRLCALNEVRVTTDFPGSVVYDDEIHVWICRRLQEVGEEVESSLLGYRFDRVSDVLYHFLWDDFCDWYVEWCKRGELKGEVSPLWRQVAGYVLGTLLHWLHPVMPYVSEELWVLLGGEGVLMKRSWPVVDESFDEEVFESVKGVMEIVVGLRGLRSVYSEVEWGGLRVRPYGGDRVGGVMRRYRETLLSLSRFADLEVVEGFEGIYMVLSDGSGVQSEGLKDKALVIREGLLKENKALDKEASRLESRLKSEGFLQKASAEVVEESRRRLSDVEGKRDLLRRNMGLLGGS